MTLRILDVLNFSNGKNPQADSGVRLQKELIAAVLRRRSDVFFYLLVPTELAGSFRESFPGGNVQVLPAGLLSRQQGGAFSFDVRELASRLDLRRSDIDLLFVNQPELTAPLLDFFNKVHFFDVHSFGYVHWLDWKRSDNVKNRWNLPATLTALTSILLSTVTGCNSRYGKEQILKEAGRWFSAAALERLDGQLIPLWPGVQCREILEARTAERFPVKTLIFPFRAQKYTGFKSLVEVHLAGLWRRRRDFRLLLTNPSDYDFVKTYPRRFPFLQVCRLDRREYLQALWKADLVVGCHNGANQWSLAAVEALAAECVPLFNQSSFFPEMLRLAAPHDRHAALLRRYTYYRQTFRERLESLLDNLDEERRRVAELSESVRRFYDWDNRVPDWIRCFEAADAASPSLTERSGVIGAIEGLLCRTGGCTKEAILRHLRWHPKSRHISWTRYRKYLRARYAEDSRSPVVAFTPRPAYGRARGESPPPQS
jgi:hypothetical protein